MRFHILAVWFLFVFYCALLIVLPFTLLWDWSGFYLGSLVVVVFLSSLGFTGAKRIGNRLNYIPKTSIELPRVAAFINEYCRRLHIPAPEFGIIESPSINFALFGFSINKSRLAITRGALEQLSRDELGAMIAWSMVYLWHGDVVLKSWLSQFLAVFDSWVTPNEVKHKLTEGRLYSLRVLTRQFFLYPFTLFPIWILNWVRCHGDLDKKALRLTQNGQPLIEAFRKMEALQLRFLLYTSYSNRHLFFMPPQTKDPLFRLFLSPPTLSKRIEWLNFNLNQA